MTESEKIHNQKTANERWDDLMRCGYKILQNPDYFCFGMDAVLLSGFARVEDNDAVLDLGTGNGILPILLAAKTGGKAFVGLEIQEPLLDMANRSVLYNHLEDRITFCCADIKHCEEVIKPASFDVVVTNPPYMIGEHGKTNHNEALSIARHEVLCTLEDVLYTAQRALRPQGRFFMVHRPFRLAEILHKMRSVGLEPKRMRLVYPYIDKEPNMVLIEGIRHGKSEIKIEKPLIVYEAVNQYTKEILDIYGF